MQTFLPEPDFAASATLLDPRRLGKQRVETLQVLRALIRPTYGWKHHPVVLMWAGYEEGLASYGLVICAEWTARGFADTVADSILIEVGPRLLVPAPRTQATLAAAGELPPWLGDPAFHRSHRSSLLRKDPDWYRPRLADTPADLEYVWPVRKPAAESTPRPRRSRAERPSGGTSR